MKEKTGKKKAAKRLPPVSLAPLSFDQAITGLLQVKPKKKATAKKKGGQ